MSFRFYYIRAKIAKYRIFRIFVWCSQNLECFTCKIKAMRYFIRAVKYFVYFALITTLIVLALVLIGAVEGDINSIFEGGYNALWKMALFFALVAAVYPKFGFISRKLETQTEWDTMRDKAIRFFSERRYMLETETEDQVTFRRKDLASRITKMGEDRLTLSRTEDGYVLEGLRKDVILYATSLEDN